MLSKDIRVGGVYRIFVAGYPTAVRIVGEHPNGGWSAKNLQTGREVRVRTAASLGPAYVPFPPSAHPNRWSD